MDSSSLDYIASSFGTDKSTRTHLPPAEGDYPARPEQGHGYTIFYEHYLSRFRSRPIRLLEIGVLDGKSLATWNEYYPEARIYGLDIDPACSRFENERTKIFIGSQANKEFLADICKKVPEGFDVIIDDGSHYVKHIIASFRGLFDHLKPGGTYVIEDLQIAASSDWGTVPYNKGMALEPDGIGNDPALMVRFLEEIRQRKDVAELILHLKKICFIRKMGEGQERVPWERGDRLESLLPPAPVLPPKRTIAQKIVGRLRE